MTGPSSGASDSAESGSRGTGPHRAGGAGASEATVVDAALLRRATTATSLGNAMEWFDYGVYAYLAVTMSKVFFPTSGSSGQLISTFATYAAGLLLRPFGGLVLGPLGDRVGRQRMLALTMIVMALGTFSIGLIPSYGSIGYLAPVLLLVARCVQGLSTGGEYGGAMTFLAEHAPDRRRGFFGSWLEFGTLAGFVLGSGITTALTGILGSDSMVSWGWRIPFLLGGPLGAIGVYLRLRLEETPAFQQHRERSEIQTESAGEQLRQTVLAQWRPLLVCIGLVIVFNVPDYMLLSTLPSYLSQFLHFDQTQGLLIVLLAMVIMMALITFVGRASDRVGRRTVIAIGCAGFFLLSLPSFLLMRQGTTLAIFAATLELGLALVCFTSTMPSALPALFPTGVRYGSLSLGFNISVSLFGGTTPLVVTAMISVTGTPLFPAFYMMAAAVIGAVAVLFMGETAQRPLEGSSPTVETRAEADRIAGRGE